MNCLKCGGPYTTCSCGGIYCAKCDDPDACPRCCFCNATNHTGKNCPERKSKEPALRALLDQWIPD